MKRSETAFTLIEILMVVLIMAILGSVVIAHFNDVADESKDSSLQANLRLIRAQLELYKAHHNGKYPTDIDKQLGGRTDADGTLNPNGLYGPYLHVFPANAFIANPVKAVTTKGAPGDGWHYDDKTGVIAPGAKASVEQTVLVGGQDGSVVLRP